MELSKVTSSTLGWNDLVSFSLSQLSQVLATTLTEQWYWHETPAFTQFANMFLSKLLSADLKLVFDSEVYIP
jgi:hypothetical protein